MGAKKILEIIKISVDIIFCDQWKSIVVLFFRN